jgi:cytochrome c553
MTRAFLLTLMLAATAAAAEPAVPPRIVTWVCSGCHALDGNTQLPTMPRLAGQSASYMEAQLAAFRAAPAPASLEIPSGFAKPTPLPPTARGGAIARIYMIGPAHAATADEAKAAAVWYAAQKPAPGLPLAAPALAERGQKLYTLGDAVAGIIACRDCHGAEARGRAEFPALAGQHADYLERQLQAFVNGDRPLGIVMHGVAKNLSAEDRQALARYLQSL